MEHQAWENFLVIMFFVQVEEMCLRMFIKGLNSDVNAVEANRRHKTKRSEIEKRLSRGFWLLSQMMKDRVSLFL